MQSAIEEALKHQDAGNHHLAIELFQEVLKVDSTNSEIWNKLGNSFAEINENQAAIDAYEEAIKENPQNADAWNNLGVSYAELGHHDSAIQAYNEAIRYDSTHTDAWNNRGASFLDLEKYERAVKDFKKVVTFDEQHLDGWYNLGQGYELMHDYEKAQHAYESALGLDSSDNDLKVKLSNLMNQIQSEKEILYQNQVIQQFGQVSPTLKNSLNIMNEAISPDNLPDPHNCGECGEILFPEDNYCPMCGSKYEEPPKQIEDIPKHLQHKQTNACVKCDYQLLPEDIYCPNCGYEDLTLSDEFK